MRPTLARSHSQPPVQRSSPAMGSVYGAASAAPNNSQRRMSVGAQPSTSSHHFHLTHHDARKVLKQQEDWYDADITAFNRKNEWITVTYVHSGVTEPLSVHKKGSWRDLWKDIDDTYEIYADSKLSRTMPFDEVMKTKYYLSIYFDYCKKLGVLRAERVVLKRRSQAKMPAPEQAVQAVINNEATRHELRQAISRFATNWVERKAARLVARRHSLSHTPAVAAQPQALPHMATGNVPSHAFARAKLPIAGSAR